MTRKCFRWRKAALQPRLPVHLQHSEATKARWDGLLGVCRSQGLRVITERSLCLLSRSGGKEGTKTDGGGKSLP